MILTLHNPRPTKPEKKTKRARTRRAKKETTTMAKSKSKSKSKRKTKRARAKNPGNPTTTKRKRKAGKRRSGVAARSTARKRNPGNPTKRSKGRRRRRRNPDTSEAAKKILMAVGAGIAAGALVTLGATFAAPSGNAKAAYYGLGAAGVVAGALLAKKRPELGAGVAAGAAGTTLIPMVGAFVSSKLLAPKMSGMGEMGMGAIAYDSGGREPARLGMGEVSYENMGEVSYENMGDIADAIALNGNPFG